VWRDILRRAKTDGGHRKSAWGLDVEKGLDGKMDGEMSVDPFQACCEREISAGKDCCCPECIRAVFLASFRIFNQGRVAMYGLDDIGWCLLAVALATLLVAILVGQSLRNKRTVSIWLVSGLVGILLGVSAPYAVMRLEGYELTRTPAPTASAMAMGMPGMGMAGGGMCPMTGQPKGEMKGAPGMGGGPAPGMTCPMTGKPLGEMKGTAGMAGAPGMTCPMTGKPIEGAKGGPAAGGCPSGGHCTECLTTLVQKLELLTGDIAITLSPEQAAAVNDCLRDVEKSAKLSSDEAKAKRNKLMAALNEKQKASLAAIGLPQPAHSAAPAAASETSSCCGGHSGGSCPTGGEAAAKQDENQNPFQKDEASKAVKSLRERLASKTVALKTDAPKVEAPKAPPAKSETPKASAPKADAPKTPAGK
jgi:hypothetical protein